MNSTIVAWEDLILTLSEIGGRPEQRKIWKRYLDLLGTVHAVVFLVDYRRESAYREARQLLKEVMCTIRWVPVLVFANNYKPPSTRGSMREGPAAAAAAKVAEELRVAKYAAKWKHQVSTRCCDFTVEGSNPPEVKSGMRWLTEQLIRLTAVPPPKSKRLNGTETAVRATGTPH